MKYILLIALSLQLFATDLNQLLEHFENSPNIKYLQAQNKAKLAGYRYELAYNTPNIDLGIAHAEDIDKDGYEYSIGVSQTLDYPLGINARTKAKNLFENANALDYQTQYVHAKNALIRNYNLACTAKEKIEHLINLQNGYHRELLLMQKAFKYGEIAKKDLLFHQIRTKKFEQNLFIAQREYERYHNELSTQLPNTKINEIICSDMTEIDVEDFTPNLLTTSMQALQVKNNAYSELHSMHDNFLQSVEYTLSYDEELDKEIYGLSLSIPLSFASEKTQALHQEHYFKKLALQNELAKVELNTQQNLESLRTTINSLAKEYQLLQYEVLPMSKELHLLLMKAYEQGEVSIIEYLEASRSHESSLLETLALKKEYYKTLFEFYNTQDKVYGEDDENSN